MHVGFTPPIQYTRIPQTRLGFCEGKKQKSKALQFWDALKEHQVDIKALKKSLGLGSKDTAQDLYDTTWTRFEDWYEAKISKRKAAQIEADKAIIRQTLPKPSSLAPLDYQLGNDVMVRLWDGLYATLADRRAESARKTKRMLKDLPHIFAQIVRDGMKHQPKNFVDGIEPSGRWQFLLFSETDQSRTA